MRALHNIIGFYKPVKDFFERQEGFGKVFNLYISEESKLTNCIDINTCLGVTRALVIKESVDGWQRERKDDYNNLDDVELEAKLLHEQNLSKGKKSARELFVQRLEHSNAMLAHCNRQLKRTLLVIDPQLDFYTYDDADLRYDGSLVRFITR